MVPLVDLVACEIDAGGFDLEQATLGASTAAEVAAAITQFVLVHVGTIKAAIFYKRSTGLVVGLLLTDGREVVVKIHRWRVSSERLAAAQQVQAHLARTGIPAPRPLLAPQPLGAGIATVEELRRGAPADGHAPTVRRAMASGLCAFVKGARAFSHLRQLGTAALLQPAPNRLYPEPHDLRFDFESSAVGAEWIDEAAGLASSRLAEFGGDPVVGHVDWSVQNVGFDAEAHLSAIYDWDSVALAPEPFIVGSASAQFTADWARGAALPSLEETLAFVAEYEEERGCPFDRAERTALRAAHLLQCAYGARCEHSDRSLGRGNAGATWIRLLRETLATADRL